MARGAGRALGGRRKKHPGETETWEPGWSQAGRVLGSKEWMGDGLSGGRAASTFPFLSSPWDSSCVQGTQGSVLQMLKERLASLSLKITAWVEGSFSILIRKSDSGCLSLDLRVWSYPEWPEALQPWLHCYPLALGHPFLGLGGPEGGDTGLCSQMRCR